MGWCFYGDRQGEETKLLCVLVGIGVWEFVGRRGSAKRWAVDIEEVFWEARIIEDEEDKNLPWEGGVGRAESVAAAADSLSDKDCEIKWSPDWAGEEADGDGKSAIVRAAISNGIGRSITMGSLGVGSD